MDTKVVKIYGSSNWADDEAEKMRNLRVWLMRDAPEFGAFKVAKFKTKSHSIDTLLGKEKRFSADIQNIVGVPLDALLKHSKVSKSQKALLLDLYRKRLDHYVQRFIEEGFEMGDVQGDLGVRPPEDQSDLWIFLHPPGKKYVFSSDFYDFYFLKPDQVIVDLSTLDMTIIDPF